MTRKRPGRRADIVWIICSDPRHRGEPCYERDGHHVVGTIGARDGRLTWHGRRGDKAGEISTSGITLSVVTPPLPVKNRRRDDGSAVWRFPCSCGRAPERPEGELATIIGRHRELKPGKRVELDLVRFG